MSETVRPATLLCVDGDEDVGADWCVEGIHGWDVAAVALERAHQLEGRVTLHHGLVLDDNEIVGPAIEVARNLHTARNGRGTVATEAFVEAARPLPHDADPRPLWPYHATSAGARVELFTLFGTDRSAVALPRANFGPLTGPLFGRDDARDELLDVVADHQVVVLKGPPGIGKTSLARHVAWRWAISHAPSPTWFVSATNEPDRGTLVREIARAVGVLQDLPPGREERELHLAQVLGNLAPNLLVLDGVDESVEGAAELATQLTAISPDTRVVLTSQVAPSGGGYVSELAGLRHGAAVRLFLHRRGLRRPEVPIGERDLRHAATVAEQLAGTPAAIELVSAALQASRLPQIGADPATGRAVEWAGGQLAGDARQLLRELQVFQGPFDFRHVAAISTLEDVESHFETLLDLSLVGSRVDEDPVFFVPSTVARWVAQTLGSPSAEARGRWLDAWGERAREFVEAAGGPEEIEEVRRYRAFARQAVEALEVARETEDPALPWLFCAAFHARILGAEELDAIFDALPPVDEPDVVTQVLAAGAGISRLLGDWNAAAERAGRRPAGLSDAEEAWLAVRAASSIGSLGERDEMAERAQAVLDLLEDDPEPRRPRALAWDLLSLHRYHDHDLDAAEELATLGLAEAMRCEHPSTIAALRSRKALIALRSNDLEAARQHYTDALSIFAALGRNHFCAVVLGNLAHVDLQLGRLSAAHNGFLQSVDLARRGLRPNPEAVSRLGLAWVELRRGRVGAAREELHRAVETLEELGNTHYAGIARAWLAVVEALRDENDVGATHLDSAREHLSEAGDETRAILGLIGTAVSAIGQGDYRALAAALDAFDRDGSSARAARTILREVVSWAEEDSVDLMVAEDGRWFQVAGEDAVDITRRSAPRRVVVALARRHVDAPGEALSLEDLFDVGWPGEMATAEAAANRVYVTIATLRKLGLRDLLLNLGDGYGFDPDRRVRIVD